MGAINIGNKILKKAFSLQCSHKIYCYANEGWANTGNFIILNNIDKP